MAGVAPVDWWSTISAGRDEGPRPHGRVEMAAHPDGGYGNRAGMPFASGFWRMEATARILPRVPTWWAAGTEKRAAPAWRSTNVAPRWVVRAELE